MNYDDTEKMHNSILKNIQELCELCVENEIYNAYDLMDIVAEYKDLIRYILTQNESPGLRGIHDKELKDLGYEIVRN